jgi:tRNA-specific 2-thiouridylase
MKVVAALSGGVDSAVAAARLVDAGHDVTGVHLALAKVNGSAGSRGCCTLDDARDARRVADMLGIPFYVWDVSERFREEVVDNFVEEYAAGHTPNPCLRCNERIKFAAVLDRALALGFDAVASGHYARRIETPNGVELHRAVDPSKDQSYVLAVVPHERIQKMLLPIGDTPKADVRAEAATRGLLVAAKPDSHDICFIPDGDTAGFLRRRLGDQPGQVVDAETGAVVGEHDGAFAFTVGQRRGLHLGSPSEDGGRRYVVESNTSTGTVMVGPPRLLEVDVIHTAAPVWAGSPAEPGRVYGVQVRAHGEEIEGSVTDVTGDGMTITLTRPLRGVAPGQAAVLYDGTRVVGSGTIARSTRR